MVKNIYEILDEFENLKTKSERIQFLHSYANHPAFIQVLLYTYDPQYQYYMNSFPKEYKQPVVEAQLEYRFIGIENELRRLYLFVKGDPRSAIIPEKTRNKLYIEMLESFEPREAQVFVNMLKKDLGVKHLNVKLIMEAFPNLIKSPTQEATEN